MNGVKSSAVRRTLVAGRWSILAAAVALGVASGPVAHTAAAGTPWVAIWTASPEPPDPDPDEPLFHLSGQTVRERLTVSAPAQQLRIRLSNEYGSTPLLVGAATIALSRDAAPTESSRVLTFAGHGRVTIAPGETALSDPVPLQVRSGGGLRLSLFFPERVSTPTIHALALKRAAVSLPGDFSRAAGFPVKAWSESSISITQVLAPARPGQKVLVAFGDSLTDGDASTVDADRNWPNDLTRRLAARRDGAPLAVVNAGVAGNRLLADGPFPSLGISGVERFERYALAVPGVTHVLLLEGGNDLGFPGASLRGRDLAKPNETRSAHDLISAYQRLIVRAHGRGVRVIGATLPPCEGADIPGYWTRAKDAQREAVNSWIRTSGAFDGVVDFDAVLRDPDHPSRLQARFSSGDHLHPNDLGYQAMANAIPVSLFS
jgi:lysophospholipase L1-like esterase